VNQEGALDKCCELPSGDVTTAEVARRQADGSWLYVIDNAWGDQAISG
jgi:hypothetical protein